MKNDILNWPLELQSYYSSETLLHIKANKHLINQYVDRIYADSHTFRLDLIHELCMKKDVLPSILNSLIKTSNVIYCNFQSQVKDIEQNEASQRLRYYFIKILNLIELIIVWLGQLPIRSDKRLFELFPVTNYNCSRMRVILPKLSVELEKIIEERDIDKSLGRLVSNEFDIFCSKKVISIKDVTYISKISKTLGRDKPSNTLNFVSILFRNNFNSPAFFLYCSYHCDKYIGREIELQRQIDRLFFLENNVNELRNKKGESWVSDSVNITDQIRRHLRKKRRFFTRQLRSSNFSNIAISGKTDRMLVNLSVAQLALFIRLFIIVGVIPNVDIGKIFAFFAQHFYTKNAQFISADSLQRKSTDVESSTAKKLKAILIFKVNWINKTFRG